MFAYNSTTHSSTGYSPFFLMFGRESKLPIDCMLPFEPNVIAKKTYKQFVDNWKRSMKDAFQIAQSQAEKSRKYNKKHYDRQIKHVAIEVGDRVLVRNVDKKEDRKIKTYWEREIYEVIEKHDTVPVFTIKQIKGKKKKRVHRNMLMKVNDLPLDVFEKENVKVQGTKKSVKTPKKTVQFDKPVVVSSDSSDSSDEDSLVVLEQPFVVGRGGPDGNLENPVAVVEADDPIVEEPVDQVEVVEFAESESDSSSEADDNESQHGDTEDEVFTSSDEEIDNVSDLDPERDDVPDDNDGNDSDPERDDVPDDNNGDELDELVENESEEEIDVTLREEDVESGDEVEDLEGSDGSVVEDIPAAEDDDSATDGSTGSIFHDAVENLDDLDDEDVGSRPVAQRKSSRDIASRRKRKPRTFLTYDTLGEPSIGRYSAYL